MKNVANPTQTSSALRETVPDIQLLNAGILYISKEGELATLNDIGSELIGKPKSTGTIHDLKDLFPAHSDEQQMLEHIRATECEYRDAVVKWEVDGIVRHVLVDTFVHQSSDGQVFGMYVVMKDMGNFFSIEQTTQRAEKMATVGKLAAGIAHEIRNPLTTVKGFLQVLEHRLQEGVMDEEVQYVQVMMSEIERVNALVAELLLLSKPHDVAKSSFYLHDLLEEIFPWIQATTREHGVQMEFHMNEEILLDADRNMIRQLLLHLTKNAIEAMESGGTLIIGARQTNGRVEIDVSDTGPGIPYYMFDKIFDAFYTTKEKGTGLGLAICQRIISDHGGQIRVSSKGFGTTFTVSLPSAQGVVKESDELASRNYSLFS